MHLPLVRLLGTALLLEAASPSFAAETTTDFVDVPKGRLWYEASGQGPALVLIHDGLLPSETWDAQVGPFGRHFRVVRYDRRRYGRSITETDDFISRLDAALFAAAAGSPETRWHDGGHFAMGAGAPREERRAFLLRSLTGAPTLRR